MWMLIRGGIAALTVVLVSEVAQRLPRLGALLLTLPVISIIAFIMTWTEHHDLQTISRLAKETLVLVPLGLPFFVPLAFSERWGLSFWSALGVGVVLASLTISLWFWFGPKLA
jgi:hypothetical protein